MQITYTYKDCKPEDFTSDVSFSEKDFDSKLEPLSKISLDLTEIRLIFTKNNNRFTSHAEAVVGGKSVDAIIEGYEPSEVVRASIKQLIQMLRDKKEKAQNH